MEYAVSSTSEGLFSYIGLKVYSIVNHIFLDTGIYALVILLVFLTLGIKFLKDGSMWNTIFSLISIVMILAFFVKPDGRELTPSEILVSSLPNSDPIEQSQFEESMNEIDLYIDGYGPPKVFLKTLNSVNSISNLLVDAIDASFRVVPFKLATDQYNAKLLTTFTDGNVKHILNSYNNSCYWPALSKFQNGVANSDNGKIVLSKNIDPFQLKHEGVFSKFPELRLCNTYTDTLPSLVKTAMLNSPDRNLLKKITDAANVKSKKANDSGSILAGTKDPNKDTTVTEDEAVMHYIAGLYNNTKSFDKDMLPKNSVAVEKSMTADVLTGISNFFNSMKLYLGAYAFIDMYPYAMGAIVAFMLIIFPVILIYSLFPDKLVVLADYFKFYLFIKSWAIIFSLGMLFLNLLKYMGGSSSIAENAIYMMMLGAPAIAYPIIKGGSAAAAFAFGGAVGSFAQQTGNQSYQTGEGIAKGAASVGGAALGGAGIGIAQNLGIGSIGSMQPNQMSLGGIASQMGMAATGNTFDKNFGKQNVDDQKNVGLGY